MKSNVIGEIKSARRFLVTLLLAVSCLGGAMTLTGQQPTGQVVMSEAEVKALEAVRSQQKEILVNMQKIEGEMALLAEDIRQTRILVSRSGR